MQTFWSCHLIINRTATLIVGALVTIDAYWLGGKVLLPNFLQRFHSLMLLFLPAIMVILAIIFPPLHYVAEHH